MCAIEVGGERGNCTKWRASEPDQHFQNGKRYASPGQTFAYRGNQSSTNQADDKVLTPSPETCDTISKQFEDFMARQNGRGSSRPRLLIRKLALASSPLEILALLLAL